LQLRPESSPQVVMCQNWQGLSINTAIMLGRLKAVDNIGRFLAP